MDIEDHLLAYHDKQQLEIDKTLNVSHFTRRLTDILPNPWHAARIVEQLHHTLKTKGETEEDIYDKSAYLVHVLREHVKNQVEKQAEHVFLNKLQQGTIRFDLQTDTPNYKLRDKYQITIPENAQELAKFGQPVQLSLFEKTFTEHFDNEFEKKFAFYLDEQKTLKWWHRIGARQSGEYYIQGWKQERIYPDFVAMAKSTYGGIQVLLFDTKGEDREGNPDTEYKRKVLKTLEDAFNNVGKMTVNEATSQQGVFQLVFNEQQFSEIREKLSAAVP